MPTLGVDEAGKGPVLGPMLAAAVRAPPGALPDGVDDSKRLSPSRRAELAAALRSHPEVSVGVAAVPVDRIDDPGTDMNALTVDAHAAAVAAAAADGDRVLADAGEVSETRFARRLRERVGERGVAVEVTAEHGADADRDRVAAASVVAKVERDARVDAIAAEYGEVGSGYPGDPATRAFLREYVAEHGDLPNCARASWATCEDVLAATEQSTLSGF